MTGTQVDRSLAEVGFRFPWPFPSTSPSFGYRIANYGTISAVRALSRLLFVAGVNKLEVLYRERFLQALEDRSRPLVTIANHRCNIDDPLMWNMLSWPEFFRTIARQRYTLAAHNICFSKQSHTTLFALGNCVPCVRGEGIFQRGMDFSVEKLNENGWVHIFPEGKVTKDPMRIKWGVSRFVLEPRVAPIVLPIWMRGMDTVWPEKPPYYPKFGKTVQIYIGEPWDSSGFRKDMESMTSLSDRQKRKLTADRIQWILFGLGEYCGDLKSGTAARIHRENCGTIEDFR